MTEVVAAVRLVWTVLAKLPRLFGWLIRRFFSEQRCAELLRVSVPGTNTRFELLAARPAPGLCGVPVHIHNALPFPVRVEFSRATFVMDGTRLGEVTLNLHALAQAAGFVADSLSEWTPADHTADWIRRRGIECARLQVTLDWRCTSDFRQWSSSQSFEMNCLVNTGHIGARGAGT